MTAAPFRDLFVELPRALFDVLQATAEQAVREATPPPARTNAGAIRHLVEKYTTAHDTEAMTLRVAINGGRDVIDGWREHREERGDADGAALGELMLTLPDEWMEDL